jgi:phosphate-selective porin
LSFEPGAAPEAAGGYRTVAIVPANADHATTLGVNWYMNHYVKLIGDVVIESIADPSRSPSPASGGRFMTTVFLLQFQF